MKCQVRFVILSLIHIQVCFSQTTVSGDVSGFWSKSQSPYFITGSVRVQAGENMQISTGFEIIFQGQYDIQVDSGATLKAIRTEEELLVQMHFLSLIMIQAIMPQQLILNIKVGPLAPDGIWVFTNSHLSQV